MTKFENFLHGLWAWIKDIFFFSIVTTIVVGLYLLDKFRW